MIRWPIVSLFVVLSAPALAMSADAVELLGVRRIWDQAPHNAFTSLLRFQDRFVCAFREAPAHVGPGVEGKMRVISSVDAEHWEAVALLEDNRGDIRDAKLSIMPDGRLMLLTATHLHGTPARHQSVAWFTRDLKSWEGPVDVGEPNIWLWGIRWHKGVGYSIGYSTTADHFDRLYKTTDGRRFEKVVERLEVPAKFPNENAIIFDAQDVAHVLVRCDPDNACIGRAVPPYTQWTWKQTNTRIGGPALIETASGRLLGGGRLYDGKVRTALFWVDPQTATLSECLTLPSGGDTSYPGLVFYDDLLYVSYYSSHEKKTAIYLAKCRLPSDRAGAGELNRTLIEALEKRGEWSSVHAMEAKNTKSQTPPEQVPIDIGSRRELFVDHFLIDRMSGAAELRLHRPIDRGSVLGFDAPWEGRFCAYVTILHPAPDKYQMYYRGANSAGDTSDSQVTCYAESNDGIHWLKPELDLYSGGSRAKTNIVLAHAAPVTHNFCPFIDSHPGVKPDQRYKAVGGYYEAGLFAYASPDGIHWKKLVDGPILTHEQISNSFVFDSQNVAFWSEAEGKYLLFYRVYKDKKRRIARVESDDFLHWVKPTLMGYERGDGRPAPVEELYTNQTQPYFRAPHLYIATAARFMLNRQVITTQQAADIQVDPKYFHDVSDAVLMTSRGGNVYQRTFMDAFVAPELGAENWTSRTNYPALNIVQTGPTEMSLYVNENYAQPTSHLRRYALRLDGFASVRCDYDGGEMVTRVLKFSGSELLLNFATSAPGSIRVEVQDETGRAIPGFVLADCVELVGNEIERPVTWRNTGIGTLAGRAVRLHFVMKDADLYAIQFRANSR